jgi:potassium/hydrogen antiporter
VTHEQLNLVAAVVAATLLVAVLAVRWAGRLGLPSLLLYLAIGLLLGESGVGITFENFDLTRSIGFAALAIILAEGGLTTRWTHIRPVLGFAGVLATVGVVVSVVVVALGANLLLGVDVRTAVLFGAVVASTDAAAVFAVMRTLPIRRRLGATLEAESGLNDPTAVILVTLAASDAWTNDRPWELAGMIGYELIIGITIGVAIGFGGRAIVRRSALPMAGLYPIAVLAVACLAFGLAGLLHASGFAAVYVAGLVLGNARLPHRAATLAFAEGAAQLAQIGLFVMLGLLASPGRLPHALWPALVVGLLLTFIARPIAVMLCALPFRVPRAEQVFLSWAGLRGAVPIVLATIPATEGYRAPENVFDVVFVLVVVYTAIQAPTLPMVARRLGIVSPEVTTDLSIESAPLDESDRELLDVTLGADSQLVGLYVDALRLPGGASVTLILRPKEHVVPERYTRLRAGDRMLIVTPTSSRSAAETRIREVALWGQLGRWNQGATPAPGPEEYAWRWRRAVSPA